MASLMASLQLFFIALLLDCYVSIDQNMLENKKYFFLVLNFSYFSHTYYFKNIFILKQISKIFFLIFRFSLEKREKN